MTAPPRRTTTPNTGAPWREYDRDDVDDPGPVGAPLPEGVEGRPLGNPRRRNALIAGLRVGR